MMQQRPRSAFYTIFFLAVFVVGMGGAVASTGWDNAISAISNLGYLRLFVLILLASAHYIIRAFRWHLLASAADLPTSIFQNMRHFFGGFAMTATPGRVGELVRLRWIGRETGWPIERSAPIAFADRALELLGVVMLILITLSLTNLGSQAITPILIVSLLIVWISCRPSMLMQIVLFFWRLTGKAPRFFVRLKRITIGLNPFMKPSVLVPSTLLGVLGWFLEGLAFYILLSWLNVEISIWAATAIFLISVLSGALSGLPGGLGGTEAALIALLVLQGVSTDTAIISTAVIRITTLWYAVLIGICVFPLSEASSKKLLVNK